MPGENRPEQRKPDQRKSDQRKSNQRKSGESQAGDSHREQARRLHQRVCVIDTHCDTTQRLMDADWDFSLRHADGHIDIPRLREGGVDAVFLAIFAAGPLPPGEGSVTARDQLDVLRALPDRYPEHIAIADSAGTIVAAREAGRIAVVPVVEGGYLIDGCLDTLEDFFHKGVRYMTLTHGFHTEWADSSGIFETLEPLHGGLTGFGRDVVRLMQDLGMMVDVSHTSDDTVRNVLDIARAPVIASHSCCHAVNPHPRNLTDELIRGIAATGGLVQINASAAFLDPAYPPVDPKQASRWLSSLDPSMRPPDGNDTPLSIMAEHVEHAVAIAGEDHVGIGTDFDGVLHVPRGLEDCARLPELTAILLARGMKEETLEKILGANVLRVMGACAKAAGKA